jgi:hypothetical protein
MSFSSEDLPECHMCHAIAASTFCMPEVFSSHTQQVRDTGASGGQPDAAGEGRGVLRGRLGVARRLVGADVTTGMGPFEREATEREERVLGMEGAGSDGVWGDEERGVGIGMSGMFGADSSLGPRVMGGEFRANSLTRESHFGAVGGIGASSRTTGGGSRRITFSTLESRFGAEGEIVASSISTAPSTGRGPQTWEVHLDIGNFLRRA